MPDRTCSVEGCEASARVRGWCKKHYERWRRTGSLDLKPKPQDPGCKVRGCTGRHRALGYCYAHYMRWYRKGTTSPTYEPGHQALGSSGYYHTQMTGHPLANSSGRVYVHRVVLWDSIGPGEHPCHWCGWRVRWDWVDRAHMLNVDHIDHDKRNNDVSNLVPACTRCNSTRTKNPDWFANNITAGIDAVRIAYALPI